MTCRLPHHDLTGTSNRWVSHGLADVAAARSAAPPPDWRRSGRPVGATRIVGPCLVNRCLTAQRNDAVDGLPTGGRDGGSRRPDRAWCDTARRPCPPHRSPVPSGRSRSGPLPYRQACATPDQPARVGGRTTRSRSNACSSSWMLSGSRRVTSGPPFSSFCWDRVIGLLDAPVLAIDLPGRGRHPGPLDKLHLADFIESAVEDIEGSEATMPSSSGTRWPA